MQLASGIIITQQPTEVLSQLQSLRINELLTIIDTEQKEFLVADADQAIAKAYVASEVQNFIILMAPRFSTVAQNRLLKILEEPPKNKHFILITESKSSLLPTIKSRLPIRVLSDSQEEEAFELDMSSLNLARAYEFTQKHNRLSAVACKVMIEKISLEAMRSGKYNLDSSTLKVFSDSIKALEVGSPTSFVLNTVLLKLLAKKRR
jgi:DNA polymerase-3 subunit delta'